MIIYCAHPATREYIGDSVADPDPLTAGNWLIPAHAYIDAPPAVPAGMAAQRSEDGSGWVLVDDHRGTTYDTRTGATVIWRELGSLPDHLTTSKRPSLGHHWNGSEWAFDAELHAELMQAERQALRERIDVERDRRIDAGIEFNGVTFQSRAGDRENIAGSAQLAFMAIVAGAKPGDLRWADAAADFFWIASDNTRVPMDAQTVVEFGKVAALSKQAHIIAGSNLKQLEPIPADYADDKWWP